MDTSVRPATIRAARAYAGIKASEMAAHLDLSVETLSRMENGRRDKPISLDELHAVHELTGVPLSFLLEGFPEGGDYRLNERVADLEANLAEIAGRLALLEASPEEEGASDRPGEAEGADGQ